MKPLILLSVVMATALAVDNTYVVVAPSKIRPNMDLAVSVNILKGSGDVNVKATVLLGKTLIASGQRTIGAGSQGEISMQLPQSMSFGTYTLSVEGSGGLQFSNSTTIQYNPKEMSVFIQTQKPIYKPGDTVKFRTFSVYSNLKSYTGTMDIAITDANGNKIKQWKQVTPDKGVFAQELALSSQPVLGDWKISVTASESSAEKVFTVAEYVLPKFETTVEMPSYVLTTETDVTFTVRAKYTYGKPVEGSVEASLKLLYSYFQYDYSRALPVAIVKGTLANGEVQLKVPVDSVKNINKRLNQHILIVSANVTETLTGNTMTGNGTVTMYDNEVVLEFPETNPDTFKPGLQYTAYLKVSKPDGTPADPTTQQVKVTSRATVELDPIKPTPYYWYTPPTKSVDLPLLMLNVPSNGLIQVPVSPPADAKNVYVTAEFRGVRKSLNLAKSHSPSKSYMQLALKSGNSIQAGDTVSFGVRATQPLNTLVYQILSRGQIVKTGTVAAHGTTSLTFDVTSDPSMAPNARIVVYYVRGDGEIVTDSISFDVGGAFENKVSIAVEKAEVKPGEKVKVTVNADPASTAHLLAIDQSVLLLKTGNDVTADDVYTELKSYDTISTNSHSVDLGFGGGPFCPNCRRKRSIWWPYPTYFGGSDASKIFDNAGVVVLTDALVYHHIERYRPMPWFRSFRANAFPQMEAVAFAAAPGPQAFRKGGADLMDFSKGGKSTLAEPARVRTFFPEAWLWNQAQIGSNGSASVVTTVPDTITSWVASAFAVNDNSGLGISPTQAHLKVFRPFFVSLNLPYSVTRGEYVTLQAIVFNYLSTDMTVLVTLALSPNFMNVEIDVNGMENLVQKDAVQQVLVKAGEAKSVYFPIVPAKLGKISLDVKAQSSQAGDAVNRQLLVEAEGVPKQYNVPVLINLEKGSFTEMVDLNLPLNTVIGSEFMRITAVGDLMGPTITNLDSLLRMPTGCGEQTMLSLAPNVYVTDYLKTANQLTGETKEKAIRFMNSGYQRELTYKHKDGSFSAFGERDDSGSTWLTAFVARVFHQARSHVFIDDNVVITAINWLIGHQNTNGSFAEPGRVIHKNMQGQAGKGTGLTLFVLISMLENRPLFANTNAANVRLERAIASALAYAEAEVAKTDDLYILAMASYAFQLANSPMAQAVLDKLDTKATLKDGMKFWHQPEDPTSTKRPGTWHSPNPTKAVDTEMTSYVLLTYNARDDIVSGKDIMQWVVKQRNPQGGFVSTQDTVVALQALSEFANISYSGNFNANINVKLNSTSTQTFAIDASNSLISQYFETTAIPNQVEITATGSGMALVELAVFFNVESEVEEVTFDLTVKLLEETINHLVVETCTSWLGEGPSSGMAIQEIGIPSGFDADLESFSQLKTMKRIEPQNKKVVLYFDEIGVTPICLNFRADRTGLVAKSQPVAVQVADYYEPGNQVTVFYQSQILKDSTVCDVCIDCENCV